MFERIKCLLAIDDEQQFKDACHKRIGDIIHELKDIWHEYSLLDWACIFTFIALVMTVCFVVGFKFHISLMETMNHTNGMEHTTNHLQKFNV